MMAEPRDVSIILLGVATLVDDDTVAALLKRSGIYAGMLIGEVLIESVGEE
jgi:hypothetical protein